MSAPQAVETPRPQAQAYVAEPPAPAPAPAPAYDPSPVVQAAAPIIDHSPTPAPAPAPVARAPQADPKEVLSTAGLVMIETDPSRAKSYTLEEEKVQLGRPRREKPKQAQEQLMQVETKN
jgi:hypothetical protein